MSCASTRIQKLVGLRGVVCKHIPPLKNLMATSMTTSMTRFEALGERLKADGRLAKDALKLELSDILDVIMRVHKLSKSELADILELDEETVEHYLIGGVEITEQDIDYIFSPLKRRLYLEHAQ